MTKQVSITRRLEFDSGHRIPSHGGQCRNIHGHRYRLDLTLSGEVLHKEGASDDGMILDFGDIKTLANEHLVSKWDHAFLIYRGDTALLNFLQSMDNHKTVVLESIPHGGKPRAGGVRHPRARVQGLLRPPSAATRLVLFETPNCWAEVSAPVRLPAQD